MIADIMNVEVVTIEIEEGPALGAAILSMVGSHEYISVEEACRILIKPKKTFYPNSNNVTIYQTKYQLFSNIYPTIKTLF